MKALTGSSSLKVVCLEKERWKLFWSQRPEICFLGLPSGRHNGKFSLLSSVERKNVRPIFAASSDLSSSASNSQVPNPGGKTTLKEYSFIYIWCCWIVKLNYLLLTDCFSSVFCVFWLHVLKFSLYSCSIMLLNK